MEAVKVICDYCGAPAAYTDSSVVYGRSYGMIYYCEKCRAWVGVHKGSDKPLGRLANAELREYRRRAHGAFDRIWKRNWTTRGKAYEWLSIQMNLTRDETHIGMFDVDKCRKTIELCAEYAHAHKAIASPFDGLDVKDI